MPAPAMAIWGRLLFALADDLEMLDICETI